MRDFKGRTAVITGGAAGIGLAFAEVFAAQGMAVVLGDIEVETLQATVKRLRSDGVDAVGVPTDVRDPAAVVALRDAALEATGDVSVVCLNAGVAPTGTVLETDLATWRWVMDVNLFGVVHGISAFAPLLVARGSGHIVITASGAGLGAGPFLGAYSASKHAVVGLAAVLRDELAPSGVGVTAVCPATIRTAIFHSERNRPVDQAGGTHADDGILGFYREIADGSPPPSVVAEEVLLAVRDDRLFALPNAELDPLLAERHDLIQRAVQARGAGG